MLTNSQSLLPQPVIAGITEVHHHTQLFFFFLLQRWRCIVELNKANWIFPECGLLPANILHLWGKCIYTHTHIRMCVKIHMYMCIYRHIHVKVHALTSWSNSSVFQVLFSNVLWSEEYSYGSIALPENIFKRERSRLC
jgi:hypothetical protein